MNGTYRFLFIIIKKSFYSNLKVGISLLSLRLSLAEIFWSENVLIIISKLLRYISIMKNFLESKLMR